MNKTKYWLLVLLGMILFGAGTAQLVSRIIGGHDYQVSFFGTLITFSWWVYPMAAAGMIIVHRVYYTHIKPANRLL